MSQPTRGGYQPPARPAPASGPGRMSKRTDGQPLAQLPDAAYGEQKTFQAAQKGAPMAEASPVGGPTVSPLDTSRVTPLDAPSQFPGEPVTSGADAGPGPGSAAVRVPDPSLQYMKSMLPALEIAANQPTTSVEFRQMVRRLSAS
jgi:hypothetical protein